MKHDHQQNWTDGAKRRGAVMVKDAMNLAASMRSAATKQGAIAPDALRLGRAAGIATAMDYPDGDPASQRLEQALGLRRLSFQDLATKAFTIRGCKNNPVRFDVSLFNIARGVKDWVGDSAKGDEAMSRATIWIDEQQGEVILAFQQTKFVDKGLSNAHGKTDYDMISNASWAVGMKDKQYENIMELADHVKDVCDGCTVSTAGASRGGASAMLAAKKMQVPFATLNPARVAPSLILYDPVDQGVSGIVKGEAVSYTAAFVAAGNAVNTVAKVVVGISGPIFLPENSALPVIGTDHYETLDPKTGEELKGEELPPEERRDGADTRHREYASGVEKLLKR